MITESAVPSATPTTHARIFVDTSKSHDMGLALCNPGNEVANITLTAFEMDGTTKTGTGPRSISLAGNGHTASFVGQQIGELPVGFRGVLDIACDAPFLALTLRALVNERGDFLFTTFPIADMNVSPPSPLVIPQFADGGGFTTEFILMTTGSATNVTINYFEDTGAPATINPVNGPRAF